MRLEEYVIIFKNPTTVSNVIQMSVAPATMIATFTLRGDDGTIKEEKHEIERIHINAQTTYPDGDCFTN